MAKAESLDSAVREIKELKELFDKIKKDSEEFYQRSKALSESGAGEAMELVEAVKSNWQTMVAAFSQGGGLASLFASPKMKEARRPQESGSSKKSNGPKSSAKSATKTTAKRSR